MGFVTSRLDFEGGFWLSYVPFSFHCSKLSCKCARSAHKRVVLVTHQDDATGGLDCKTVPEIRMQNTILPEACRFRSPTHIASSTSYRGTSFARHGQCDLRIQTVGQPFTSCRFCVQARCRIPSLPRSTHGPSDLFACSSPLFLCDGHSPRRIARHS